MLFRLKRDGGGGWKNKEKENELATSQITIHAETMNNAHCLYTDTGRTLQTRREFESEKSFKNGMASSWRGARLDKSM